MSASKSLNSLIILQLTFAACFLFVVDCSPTHDSSHLHHHSKSLSVISDEDSSSVELIKYHIANEFSNFKSIEEVINFLDKIKLLIQKHPKNVAFAQNDLKEMHKFLSQEIITRLARVDTDSFLALLSDEKIAIAQRAIDDDELTKKLFSGPLRSFIEARRQSSKPDGAHDKDGSFFANFWCKLSGNCNQ